MKKESIPAFACVSGKSNEEGSYLQEGMTLRDYFAAKSLVGIISSSSFVNAFEEDGWGTKASEMSYKLADEMLKMRNNA